MMKKFLTVFVLGLAVFAVSCSSDPATASFTSGTIATANIPSSVTDITAIAGSIGTDGVVSITSFSAVSGTTQAEIGTALAAIINNKADAKGLTYSVAFGANGTTAVAAGDSVSAVVTLTLSSDYTAPSGVTATTSGSAQTAVSPTVTLVVADSSVTGITLSSITATSASNCTYSSFAITSLTAGTLTISGSYSADTDTYANVASDVQVALRAATAVTGLDLSAATVVAGTDTSGNLTSGDTGKTLTITLGTDSDYDFTTGSDSTTITIALTVN